MSKASSDATTKDTDADPVPNSINKREQLIIRLQDPNGVSIEEVSEAFGWQPHSARAMLSGLRKAGHRVDRTKQGSVTVYRIAS